MATLVSLDTLQTGLALAADVRNRSGRLLAAQGTVLNSQHLLAFRTWGIREVEICSSNDSESSADAGNDNEQLQARIVEAARQLQPHFRLNDLAHPLIAELLRLAATRKATAGEI